MGLSSASVDLVGGEVEIGLGELDLLTIHPVGQVPEATLDLIWICTLDGAP
jgi:hypothetical protein